ncbi:MAG: metallophosphoesterase [Saprospiraceae bacterium]
MNFIIIFILLLAIDFYAFQGIKTSFGDGLFGIQANWIFIGYWLISIVLPILFLVGVFEMRKTQLMPSVWVFIGNIWFVLLISKLVLILFIFGEDIYRFFEGIYLKWFNGNQISDEVSDSFLPSRRKFISNSAILLAAFPLLSLTYGLVRGRYQYKIHKQQVFYKDLPEAFDGFTITQISDIHAGSFEDREGVLKGIEMAKALNSDLLVFTGDLVNTYASEFDPWYKDFNTLKAKFGQFSVLGNHDYGEYAKWDSLEAKESNFRDLKNHHSNMGFRLLLDESIKIEKDGQHIQLLGVENWGLGFGKRGNLPKALSTVDHQDFKVLLSHDPTHWENEVKLNSNKIHLTLSGHTHGMQMGIEIPGFKWSPIQYKYQKWAGVYEENERYLYINRGFGVLGFRGRVGIWPEITQIELKKA